MKKFSIGVLLSSLVVLLALTARGTDAPFPPWLESLTGDVTVSPSGDVQLGSGSVGSAELATGGVAGVDIAEQTAAGEALYGAKVARFIYDVAADGGTMEAHGLGVSLPAGAVIIRSYFKIITQFTDSGSGTIALSCEDANNIKTATDITGSSANAFVEGQSTGASSAFVRGIAAACEITATPAGVAADAGKLVGWVHYVVED